MTRTSAEPLWTPSPERVERALLTRFAREREFSDYPSLWEWSVTELEEFWAAVVDFCDIRFETPGERVLGSRSMPGADWFPGARLSYAEHIIAGKDPGEIAVRHASESRPLGEWTWAELREQTARIAAGLRRLGVGEGDRVCAYMPNIPETIAAFLACASIGAIWSSAAPEFGARSVVDRFAQIEPKVLLAIDGYRYGGRDFDRSAVVAEIAAEIGARQVRFGYLDGSGWEDGFLGEPAELTFAQLPFDHPLWVLYSSGTTGLPKPIVHGQGGILLEHAKKMHLHLDAQAGDRVFWFTTTGWMMWNFLVGVLLTDASIVLYDGNPAGEVLWDLAAESGMTTFGTSAAYISACMKDEVEPGAGRDLSALRAVGSTGSPLSPEGFRWVYDHVGADTWLFSTSGGTDVCTAFVGGVPTLPVHLGELQARSLGCRVEAWDEDGQSLVGEVGELVITEPMPSMPVGFWGDEEDERYREAYFEMYPGIWRHGDWIEITERGTAIIYGRSDSTINRGGVRMGTSEIYRAVLALDEVVDALVVDVPRPGAENWMPLFLWGDEDGSRYRASYFDHYPGVWRHGDWIEITSRGTAVIYGRSDSTINRQGVRMGTSEIYRAVQAVPEVLDALVVDVPRPGTEGWMPLFVVLEQGVELDERLTDRIKRGIREQCSPRHVPNAVFQVREVPRTLSGKVLEVPVKRILTGTPAEQAASRDSLANPESLDYFVDLAGRLDEQS